MPSSLPALRNALQNKRKHAKQKGRVVEITIEDLVELDAQSDICPISGIELLPFGSEGPDEQRRSIDRIDNSRGYVGGNVRIISKLCNQIRRDFERSDSEVALRVRELLSPPQTGMKSDFYGVSYKQGHRLWRACVGAHGGKVQLGHFYLSEEHLAGWAVNYARRLIGKPTRNRIAQPLTYHQRATIMATVERALHAYGVLNQAQKEQ